MLIALDFDETYSLDPTFWNEFIKMSRKYGHDIICVTMRYPNENWGIEDTIGKLCKIIYTERNAKRIFVNNLGIYPDIWIDDRPHYIDNDSINK